ncbi:class I SAM-dependent methyltransferase [Thermodesulfovibrio sp.]|jgi:ubiquinone/menaquinone biosynthesis C-methylase UbiE|uniref:class I SAM-dependent methyltransferase n=1 Tax=Thermodesulfovibrio sp. TaxID=2067987 RepID=UPI003D0E3E38
MSNPFESYVTEYDKWYDSEKGKIIYENEAKCIQKFLGSCKDRILEVGVGTGRFAVLSKNVTGVDKAFSPLKIAKLRGIPVARAKAEVLPFRDKTFSCVMFIVTLPFVENVFLALNEAKRVLKDNGSIIVGEIFLDSYLGKLYEEKKRQGHPFYRFAKFYHFTEFQEILSQCCLKTEKVFGTLKNFSFQNPEPEEPEEIDIKNFEELPGFVCMEIKKW